MALFPTSSNPLDYVQAIEAHLGDMEMSSPQNPLPGLLTGSKRKLGWTDTSEATNERAVTRRRTADIDQFDAVAGGPANHVCSRQLGPLVTEWQHSNPSFHEGEDAEGLTRILSELDDEGSISSGSRAGGREEDRGCEQSQIASVCQGSISDTDESDGSTADGPEQQSGHDDASTAMDAMDLSGGLLAQPGTGAAFDHLLREFHETSVNAMQQPTPSVDGLSENVTGRTGARSGITLIDTEAPERARLDPLFVPQNTQWPEPQMQPPWSTGQTPIDPGDIALFSQSSSPSLSTADTARLADSWCLPENISQAVRNAFPPTAVTPGTQERTFADESMGDGRHDIPDHEAGAARQDEWAALRDTLSHSLSEDDSISVYGASLTRAHVDRLLAELQTPGGLSDFSVDLLGERLARQHHAQNLRIGDVGWKDQLHRGSLRLYPLPRTLLLPDSRHGNWSLIEVQTSTGAVVHYSFASKEPSAHDVSRPQACSTCQAATTALSQHLRECQQPCPEWQVDHQRLASDREVDRSETRFLWTMAQRAGGLPVQGDPPDTFRSSLAQTIVAEVLQSRTSQPPSLIGGLTGLSRHEKAERRWSAVTGHSGTLDLTSTWQRVAQMPLGGAPMGWEQADRLLQLTFNIASPAVLVGIKRQLSHLRAREHDATRPFGRSAAGVFEAGLWHKSNEQSSRIGLALTCWYVHDLRQQHSQRGCPDPLGQTVGDIIQGLPADARDYRQVEDKVKEWSKRAWPWKQLARIARSPNILCFLPQGVGYFSGEEGSSMTDYRTLKKTQFEAMEAVLQQFRPRLLQNVPPDFFEIFLYNRLPAARFAFEQWMDEEMLQEPLDSSKFDHAFDPQPN
ncbi:hypothetical protein ASPBRDRAFT_49763 [Aspergillus brasiliensis CBS 101740]|uniref:Uncharacterized protein n=1 Tax=Aspergillus brasiliensis (strain CBS 101740 / IMI 381727 / IBT 21946) TaxID=767769 RepID=A0A1L9U1E7_ASPBC|nr:hypothetical protein ASPBRDRAFT_49763 [Aspergillus brasiliensis CBS 101740]